MTGPATDNAADVKIIDREAKQQAFSAACAQGVLDYLGITPTDKDTARLTPISGRSRATAAQMRTFLQKRNPDAPDYAAIYLEKGEAEGICGGVTFAQSCLETG